MSAVTILETTGMSAKAAERLALAKRLQEAINKLDMANGVEETAAEQFSRLCVTNIWGGRSVGEIAGPDAVAAFRSAIKKNCAAAIAEAQRELEAVQ